MERGGRREGRRKRDNEVEIHSARNFFSPAVLMFYAWHCCAYFKGLLDMVYCIHIHTHTQAGWYFELAVNCTIWCTVGKRACMCEGIIRHLPNAVGGSRE